ncbi:FAD-binding monooxygenase [Streptomyces sp. MS1.HAVA.3]|uniref:FAD-binding monooxygenase n=1 Tax=Streptomyces caledonius TaxID=3134107 RepID=A0ABU8U2D5_9ACTN
MNQSVGDRAVVLGGSIAGTFSARVLSEFYREVIVVDRDQVVSVSRPRRGTPHAGHAHGLHARGCLILEELFPNLLRDLRHAELPVGDLGEQRWYFNARPFRSTRTGLPSVTAQRPVLEGYFRDKVAALPNVTFLERTDVLGFLSTPDARRVTGVPGAFEGSECRKCIRSRRRSARRRHRPRIAYSGLAGGAGIPATGRAADDDRSGLHHTALPTLPGHAQRHAIHQLHHITPVPARAFFGQVDHTTCILSLTGILGDHPPTDPDGFLAFAKTLPVADVYEQIRHAEPLSAPACFRFPASVRRHYERLPRLPERLLVLGDAVCSLNPNYSQGMTVAAMEVMALHRHLSRGTPSTVAFMRAVGRIVDNPWFISTTSDLKYAGMKGPRGLTARSGNAYVTRLHHAAVKDPAVTNALMRVAGLIDRPTALIRPRVLLSAMRRQGSGSGPAR